MTCGIERNLKLFVIFWILKPLVITCRYVKKMFGYRNVVLVVCDLENSKFWTWFESTMFVNKIDYYENLYLCCPSWSKICIWPCRFECLEIYLLRWKFFIQPRLMKQKKWEDKRRKEREEKIELFGYGILLI